MTAFKTIIPKKLQTQAMLNAIVTEATKQGKLMLKDFDATTKTWTGDKPEFRATIEVKPQNNAVSGTFPNTINLIIAPKDDNSKGAKVWQYVNKGTSVRHAVMSKGFIPKTRTGQLNSWKGKGKMVFVSKKIKLPGIKARKWDKALSDKWRDKYAAAMQKAMGVAAKDSGHDIQSGQNNILPHDYLRGY